MIEYWDKFKAFYLANMPQSLVVTAVAVLGIILIIWFLWPSDVSDPVHDVKQSETRIELEKTKDEAAKHAETGKELHKEVEKAEKVLEVTKKSIVKRKSDVKTLESNVNSILIPQKDSERYSNSNAGIRFCNRFPDDSTCR